MNKLFKVLLICAFLITASAAVAEEVIFEGLPMKRAWNFPNEKSVDGGIKTKDQDDFKVIITKKDKKYYWKSRENLPLDHFTTGSFHFFVNPQNGYIKITKGKSGNFVYLEHVSNDFKTLTYWGSSKNLKL